MPLTNDERKSYTADQLAQIDRLDAARLDAYLEPADESGERTADETAALRAKIMGTWANMTVDQLRCRVNIDSFNANLAYSTDNDYTADEQAALNAGWKSGVGRKARDEFPAILAEDAQMKADGIGPKVRLAILRNR